MLCKVSGLSNVTRKNKPDVTLTGGMVLRLKGRR
jgi:hypothetical protein